MRIGIVILLNLIFTTLTVWAEEALPVLKAGTNVYSNATVIAVTPTAIIFTSKAGVTSVKLKDLDPALQKHFNYDAAKADAAEKNLKALRIQNSLPAVTAGNQTIDITNAQSIMDDAIARVKDIVNQPVSQFDLTPGIKVATFRPGWFHPGAIKPDFNTVDVRATQESSYSQYPCVNSDLNPDVYFIRPELEFNSMTKYFYVDRSLPKKKLTEAEMLEINRLYRIMGKCERKLNPS
jgi:hypothetical protein